MVEIFNQLHEEDRTEGLDMVQDTITDIAKQIRPWSESTHLTLFLAHLWGVLNAVPQRCPSSVFCCLSSVSTITTRNN